MGILVYSGTLPNGNVVSNVYISFTPETVHCFPYSGDAYSYVVKYNVHSQDSRNTLVTKTGPPVPPLGSFLLNVRVQDPSKEGPWVTCYNALKEMYPDSDDVLETKTPPTPEELYALGIL